MEEQSINHRQHKVMLFLLKIIPAVMAISYFLNVFCAFMGIGLQIASHYIGMFLAPMMYLYISSYVFKFCEYHRWFIHYLVVSEFVTLTDWYFKIPVSNEIMCMIHFGITGVFIVGVIIFNIYKYRTLIKNKIFTIISSIKNNYGYTQTNSLDQIEEGRLWDKLCFILMEGTVIRFKRV